MNPPDDGPCYYYLPVVDGEKTNRMLAMEYMAHLVGMDKESLRTGNISADEWKRIGDMVKLLDEKGNRPS